MFSDVGVVAIRYDEDAQERHSSWELSAVRFGPGGSREVNDLDSAHGDEAKDVRALMGEFKAADVLLVHGAGEIRESFARWGVPPPPALMDTRELASLCCPAQSDLSLDALLDALELSPVESGSLRDRCEAIRVLWLTLCRRLESWPPAIREPLNRLLEGGPTSHVLWRLASGMEYPPGESDGFLALFPAEGWPQPRELPEDDEWVALNPEAAVSPLTPGGEFAQALGSYEHREGQITMAHGVAEAFNRSQHLLVEAGTGIGKSLAYLLPAVMWTTANEAPVVVSTNTKNLQSQLFVKDLPLIQKALGRPIRTALLKGRTNYLCLRKFLQLLRAPELELDDDAERWACACLLTWLAETESGDVVECAVLNDIEYRGLQGKVTATSEECLGRACKLSRRCFLWKARRRAQQADIVVANHALVFAEMGIRSPALPPHQHLVFDEAHNIEEAATRHFSVELSAARIRVALRRLWRPGRGRDDGRGVLAGVLKQIRSGGWTSSDDFQQRAKEACRAIGKAVQQVRPQVEVFFDTLDSQVGGRGSAVKRFKVEEAQSDRWAGVNSASRGLVAAVAGVVHAIEALLEIFGELDQEGLPFHQESVHDLRAHITSLREITDETEFVLKAEDDRFVYWLERDGRGTLRAWAAPIRIGTQLAESLYQQKRSIIFCSATLTVRGSYSFLKQRLGLDLLPPERLRELTAPTPFDYRRQCAVIVPTFLPEPGDPDADYATELGELLATLFLHTKGRAMVLFTSYQMLRRSTEVLEASRVGDHIRVLSQGKSGPREQITESFRHDLESVLMGTHSFWEGVDVVGETLSCLVMARLPFAVYTDPVVAARCEEIEAGGASAFSGYTLPSAVIRFRQGFGRLIRHRSDRGVVVVADRRIITKRYGDWFRKSLPTTTVAVHDREEFFRAVKQVLEDGWE